MVTACSSSPPVGSIGVVLGRDAETQEIYVRDAPPRTAPVPDGSLELVAGDEIVMVEGVFVRDLSTKELRALLRGEPGTAVNLTVLRGAEVLRGTMKRTALRSRMLPKEERISEQ